ncbi:MAG: discoidin domain-containing protein, partial [Anaerolineae bacterium]|nr:discoidin domain-containing protein [Phycisphaerae bacterium]
MQKTLVLSIVVAFLTAVPDALGADQAAKSLLDDISKWKKIASDGVDIRTNMEGPALRMDFDFSKGAGFGGVTIDLPIDLPENYEIAFNVRGEGPANNLELKLVDESKLNVWWVNRRAFELPTTSTRLSNRKRHFQFAWGPAGGDKPLARLGSIELIIAANEGGKGTVWIEDVRLTPLAPEQPYTGTPTFSASSNWTGAFPWIAAPNDQSPTFTIDFGQPRDIGGLIITRPRESASSDFNVESSDDGVTWTTIHRVLGAGFLPSEIALPDLQTRRLRLAFSRNAAVTDLKFLETSDTASPNALWKLRAARAARGLYPRTLLGEQSFWTIIGQVDDEHEALINEEGQIEVDRKSFSIEPFILRDGKLLTWADAVSHEQSLRDGWMPIPTVVRKHDALELSITAVAT